MSVARRADVAYVAGLLFGFVVLFSFGFVDERADVIYRSDFAVIWSGARTIVDGGDPFIPADYAVTLARYGTTVNGIAVYTYPPWVAGALVPLARLSLRDAGALWTFGTLALAILSLRALLRAYAPTVPIAHLVVGAALLASQPGIASFYSGQWSYLLLAAVASLVLGLRAGRVWSACMIAILLAKPQLFVFTGWALVRAAVARSRGGYAILACATVALVLGSTVLVAGSDLSAWITQVVLTRPYDPTAPTLPSFLGDLLGASGPIVAAATVAVSVVAGLRFDPRGDAWLAVWLAQSVVVATYARSYDQIALLAPATIALGVLSRASPTRAARAALIGGLVFMVGSVLLYGIAAERGREDTSAIVGIVILGLIFAAMWPARRNA